MGGPRACFPEIIQGVDDSPAEVMFPDPVDHHPGGEGMIRAGEPAREGQASAGGGGSFPGRGRPKRLSLLAESGENTGLDRPSGSQVAASFEQVGRRGCTPVPQRAHQGLLGLFLLELFDTFVGAVDGFLEISIFLFKLSGRDSQL